MWYEQAFHLVNKSVQPLSDIPQMGSGYSPFVHSRLSILPSKLTIEGITLPEALAQCNCMCSKLCQGLYASTIQAIAP